MARKDRGRRALNKDYVMLFGRGSNTDRARGSERASGMMRI